MSRSFPARGSWPLGGIGGMFATREARSFLARVRTEMLILVGYAKTVCPAMLKKLPDGQVENALAENAPQIQELAEIKEAITDPTVLTKEVLPEILRQL